MPALKLPNLFRRDPTRASLRDRAAELQARIPAPKPAAEALPPAHAEQAAQAGLTGDVLAASGIDHRDGTVSYADATGKISRRPVAHWIGFNALQMHNRVQHEMVRRRMIEADHLSAEEHEDWQARVRRELRADAVFALTFNPQRAFKAEQDRRSGAEPTTAEGRAETDAMLLALAPEWEAARDAYAEANQRQLAVTDAAMEDERPGPAPAGSGPEWQAWFQRSQEWRERTGLAAAEKASGDACRALGAIEDRIAALPAASLAGLRLKALVAQRNQDIDVEWPERLGEGLTRDLLAFGSDGLAEEAPGGDRDLLQSGRQFEAACAREIAACEACNAAQDEANRHMPERPAALLFRASDHPLRLRKYLTHPDALEGIEVSAEDVEWMKRKPYVREVRRPVRPEDNLPAGALTVVETSPWPEAQERADEIVSAWEAWHAEKLRIHGEYVTEALDDAANDAGNAAAALAERIAALPARTAAGFKVKLRALAHYNATFIWTTLPDEPDPDRLLSHSLWRDMQGEQQPASEPTDWHNPPPGFMAYPADDPQCFVIIREGLRMELERLQTIALQEYARKVGPDASRAYKARVRQELRLNTFRDACAEPSVPNLVGMLNLASATMDELQTIHDLADRVGGVAYAHAWGVRCRRGENACGAPDFNEAGKLMQWLGDALTAVESAVHDEARRRVPDDGFERETRLSMLAVTTIDNGDPDETEGFARQLLAHAQAEAERLRR